ncbi:winged helix-turn-helix domain-containing protein [Streptomyces sp. NBC_00237]|uniref:AfsR/SARP family transcriptional regulator n=1 Tax=Streptomyces sp. NBC_00237 TaxID=2975687 RepID=UPI0022541674|nr:BTAD domain-containing putative transcriptional regulator [Streptomyces sp. NBC_00237]MCX5205101.1 winged helix-turn-helix domain-containing protein [Streptomyces sp. NBC_00237]
MRTRYEFKLLGPLEVRRDGVPVPLGAAKLRVLLVALLLEAGRVVTVDALTERLWGEEPPGRARNTVQNYVLRLRRALGPGAVLTHPQGYLIQAGPDELDLLQFGALVREGRTALGEGAPERAAVLLGKARELWRGEPLSDLPAEPVRDIVPCLVEQRLDAEELWIEAELTLGRSAAVLPQLRTLVGAHPLRERFWAQRMLALYRCGRQGEALECYREVTALLAEELGVDPGAELRLLHGRLLAADAGLGAGQGAGLSAGLGVAEPGGRGSPEPDPDPDLEPDPERPPGARPSPRPAPEPPATPARTGDLPAETTTFIGRERQVADAQRLLETSRLVCLTGVGGVGKTRLALRVAAEAAHGSPELFPDGVWLADLAPLTEPALLDRAVAAALDLRDQSARPAADAVVAHLRGRRLLLVLDNCEHLVGAVAALVLRLLRAAPGVRVLATSRERLGVPGEHVLLVPSLTLPRTGGKADPRQAGGEAESDSDSESESESEAFRLLVERAGAAAPAFRVTARNRGALAQLCHRLDGIPLAVELAAVRLGTMAAEEVRDRLDDRFRLLSVPHTRAAPTRYQQTLRGVVDWSHDLCTAGEQLLWARLSVFSGGFDLEAAEAVCGEEADDDEKGTGATAFGDTARADMPDVAGAQTPDIAGAQTPDIAGAQAPDIAGADLPDTARTNTPATARTNTPDIARADVLDLLTGLVDKSIVLVEPDHDGASPRARYRLLETLRQYGLQRLHDRDATTALRVRHCAHYRRLTARAADLWCGPDEADWLSRLDRELANVRAALDFCATRPGWAATGLEIAVNLTRTRTWFFCSTLGEGRHWLERLHGQAELVPPQLEVAAAAMKAWIAMCQGDAEATQTFMTRCRALANPAAAPAVFIEGAHAMLVAGDPASIGLLARARSGFLAVGQTGDAHMCTMLWAMAAAILGDRETAFRARDVYVAETGRAAAEYARTWALWCAGLAEERHGDPALAVAPMREALVRQHALGDRWGPVWDLETLAWAATATGHHRRAAGLLGAAHGLRQVTGVSLRGLRPFHDVHLETVERVREALGEEEYGRQWDRGTRAENCVALALELTESLVRV